MEWHLYKYVPGFIPGLVGLSCTGEKHPIHVLFTKLGTDLLDKYDSSGVILLNHSVLEPQPIIKTLINSDHNPGKSAII